MYYYALKLIYRFFYNLFYKLFFFDYYRRLHRIKNRDLRAIAEKFITNYFKYIQYHMKASKKQKKCGCRCLEHAFTMKHTKGDAYMKQDTHILFCPKFNLEPSGNQNLFPQFNRDGKVFTPAFILPIDKRYYQENQKRFLLDHEKKILEYSQQKSQILFPKPSRKHKYCSVCKDNYDDYLEHIKSSSHKRCIKASKYNNHILQLCKQLFNNESQKQVIIIEDKDSVISSQNGYKRNSVPTMIPSSEEKKPYKKRKLSNNNININIQKDIPLNNGIFNDILANNFNHYTNIWNFNNFYEQCVSANPFYSNYILNNINNFNNFNNLNPINYFSGLNPTILPNGYQIPNYMRFPTKPAYPLIVIDQEKNN